MASLWEMLGGGNFRDPSGQEDPNLGFGDVLGQNRNSLALLGMGIASGGFAGGMKGLGVGTELDQQAAYRRAQQKQHQDDLAFRQSEAKRQAGQWQQTFNRAPEAIRQMQALGITDPTEQRNLLYPKEGPKVEWQEGVPYLVNPRSQTPVVPAPGFATEPRPPITGPQGQVFTPPPGLSPAGRKKWEMDVAGSFADAATGKQTEAQAKATRFANRMEQAEDLLAPLEARGTDLTRRGLEAVPGGLGNLLQSGASQSYNTAKGAWIAGHLRADSGAVINPDEFARADRDFFPQPGDNAEQIAQKRQRRATETEAMKTSAGLGYKSPAPAAARAGPGGITPEQARAELERRRKQGGR